MIDRDVASSGSEDPIALIARVAFRRRGVETQLVLPGLAQQKYSSRCDPVLIKAIVRGRAWFEELASRDGISRRYIRLLVCLAFLSPELVEASLQGRQPVTLTATGLIELGVSARQPAAMPFVSTVDPAHHQDEEPARERGVDEIDDTASSARGTFRTVSSPTRRRRPQA